MMRTPLFLDNQARMTFEKLALSIKLSDNADNWQQEISAEIYKHLPYLSDYAVNVLLERVNPERGYAYGSAQVSNKAETPQAGAAMVTIPLLVKDRMLQPLDVMFVDGKAYPLSEDRVREHLFQGNTFEVSNRKPVDPGMVDQLQPPIRTNYGSGAGVTTGDAAGGIGLGKFATSTEKSASLCEAIASTIPMQEASALIDRIMEDEQLKVAAARNPFGDLALSIATADRVSTQKTASALVQSIQPSVVQITKLADGNFRIKWANAEAFAPQENMAGPAETADMAGSEAVQGMQPDDSITVSTDEAEKSLETPTPVPINEYGRYIVMSEEDNTPKEGWAIPVIDFDMDDLPLTLFTDGGQCYGLQDEVVGVRDGEGAGEELPVAEPQGDGAFIYTRQDGTKVATPPVTVRNQTQDPEGNASYMVETPFGEELQLSIVPGLQTIEATGEGGYGIPDTMQFTPLGQAVHLVKTEDNAEQVKEARAMPKTAFLRSTGHNEFHLSGAPFSDLDVDDTRWLDKNAATFLMVSAGLNQFQAHEKLAEARKMGQIAVPGLNPIKPLRKFRDEAVKEAQVLLTEFPYELRKDCVKEAAALEDSETADKILAMNFLNPENVSIFANYLPQLDESSQKLAEMLMASRMGMNQVDEGALERSMKNLEEVIKGLKALQQKDLL